MADKSDYAPADFETWFLVTIVRDESNIALAELCERQAGHDGIPDTKTAGNVLKAIKRGYLAASVTITEQGKKYLETVRENSRPK